MFWVLIWSTLAFIRNEVIALSTGTVSDIKTRSSSYLQFIFVEDPITIITTTDLQKHEDHSLYSHWLTKHEGHTLYHHNHLHAKLQAHNICCQNH